MYVNITWTSIYLQDVFGLIRNVDNKQISQSFPNYNAIQEGCWVSPISLQPDKGKIDWILTPSSTIA